MTPTREELVGALESSMFLLPEVPGEVSFLAIPGVRARMSSVSSPLLSLVGLSTLTAQNADATLQRVLECFRRERKAFGWLLAPGSTPGDLSQRLAAAGLLKLMDLAGMALTEPRHPIPTAPGVHIRLATGEDLERASQLLAEAYPAPEDVCRQVMLLPLRHMSQRRARVYLAYVPGRAEPVACAGMAHLPGQPFVHLFNSATLPEYRHRHLYTSLLARRLDDARREGAQAALVQAERTTSAPICRKHGFIELCNLELYAWMPPEAHVLRHEPDRTE